MRTRFRLKFAAAALAVSFSFGSAAEEAEKFSRANCVNNESITYNYWEPAEWRITFSYHQDLENNYAEHYVTSGPLVYCDYTCWYAYEQTTRAAATHSGEGGVPGVSTRWAVIGDHRTYLPWLGIFTYYWTTARDCNLNFDQFN